jgi:hypothetical protein
MAGHDANHIEQICGIRVCGKRLEYEGGKKPKEAAQRTGAEVCHRDSQLLLMSFKENGPLYAAEIRLHILKHAGCMLWGKPIAGLMTPFFAPLGSPRRTLASVEHPD